MLYEKSCGFVLYRLKDDMRVLVIKQTRNGNWSFPKGHMEGDETELETARREVMEEVGITVRPIDGFRRIIHYNPKANTEKDVVYFISNAEKQRVRLQREEVCDYKWVHPRQAFETLSFQNDRDVLKDALEFLKQTGRI